MNIRAVGFVLGLLALSAQACAANKSELKQIAELPVTMQGRQPLLNIKINGQDVRFIVDSGSFWTNTSAANASRYGLKLRDLPYSLHVSGVGGLMDAKVDTVQEFGLLSYTLKRVDIIVGGSESGYDGVLGQNLLQHYDVEYDLGHGAADIKRLQFWGFTP